MDSRRCVGPSLSINPAHTLTFAHLQILAKQEESDRRAEALFGESSLLAAWSEVKATAYAELAERKQVVLALNRGVIDPLIQFRVSWSLEPYLRQA